MKRCILLAALLTPVLVAAANWVPVSGTATAPDGFVVYLDTATILPSGGYMKAWTKSVFARDQVDDGVRYRSAMVLAIYDCAGHRAAAAKEVLFAHADGTGLVRTKQIEPEFGDAVPGSIKERVMVSACPIFLRQH